MTKKKNYKSKNEFLNVIDPWEEFNYIKGMKESKHSLLKTYKKITKFPLPGRLSNNSPSEIVVIGVATTFLLSNDFKKKCHVVLKPKDLFRYRSYLLKFFKNFTLDLRIYKNIYEQLIKYNNTEYEYIKKILLKISPKILIISSTIDPIQRVWVFWAKKLNIKIICVQHGIFSSLSAPEVLERNIVDYYFSLCKKQSKLIKKIIPLNKHRYLYSEGSFDYKTPKLKKLRICLIGTDHERYGLKGKKNKLSILKIYKSLIKLISSNLKFEYEIFYKKHPSEEFIGEIENYVKEIKDNEIDSIDIFFGIASTKLMNLASQHRCAIQISSKNFPQDEYENFNFCKTIKIEEIKKKGFKFLNQKKINIPFLKKNRFNQNLANILDSL